MRSRPTSTASNYPKSTKEAPAVDTKSGTTFWKDAIEMEMKNVMPAFEFQDVDKMPIGSQKTKNTLKNNSVAEPTVYLGAKVSRHYIAESDEPDKPRWSLSAEDYVKRAVKDVETELDKAGKFLPTQVTTPCTTDYRPELDQSKELGDAQASYYAGLIGVLRWRI
jgi:hypothetical protein